MREALMGLETEYGLRSDAGRLIMAFSGDNAQGHIVFIMKQIGKILPPECYVDAYKASGEFWTRGGMRCYPDRFNNIEVATPECSTFHDLVFQKNVGDRLVQKLIEVSRVALAEERGYTGPLEVYANNTAVDFARPLSTDPESEVTFACHENYLLRRDLYPGPLAVQQTRYDCIFENAGAFLIARPVLGGSGHISPAGDFLLSPRMAWIKSMVGGATTSGRTLVNTRDEPHADAYKFFRYHHIAGDTNITDEIRRMKIAFTYWVLRMIECGWRAPSWMLAEKASFMKMAQRINADPKLENLYRFSRKKMTARDILEMYLGEVDRRREQILFEEEDSKIFKAIASYVSRVKRGYEALLGESEWATKYFLIKAGAEKLGVSSLNHPRLRAASIAFHNLNRNPKENPFVEIRNEVLPENLEIGDLARACAKAPKTRAFVRGLAVFLGNKFQVNVSFISGREWVSINMPIHPSSRFQSSFSLDGATPWKISSADIKELIARIRPWIKEESPYLKRKAEEQSEPFYGG